jgi:thiol-disulfide isomerase/thioredoxin
MKKFLPAIFTFSIVFVSAIAIQLTFNSLKADAKEKDKLSDLNVYYEYQFQKISGETTTGKKIALSSIKSPIVIVNFWASWCLPCMEEMPSLLNLAKKFKKEEVQIVTFNTDDNEQLKNIQKTLKRFGIKDEFDVIPDKDTKIAESLKLSAIPVTIIYNRGKVVQFTNGPVDFKSEELVIKIKNWLK